MALLTTIRTFSPTPRPRESKETPYFFSWKRGPARHEDGQIVMHVDAYGASFVPRLADGIDIELSRIHTPDDAVAFVSRFGLLEHGVYWPESLYVDIPAGRVTSDDEIPSEDEEPYERFAETAAELRLILRTVQNVRLATDGDEAALAELVTQAMVIWRRQGFDPAEEDARILKLTKWGDFLPMMTSHVAALLNEGLQNETSRSWFGVSGPAWPRDPRESPDRLTLSVILPTLRAFCYWSLAQKLISRAPILVCPECQHDFALEHKRQRFCTRNCTRRARYRETQNSLAVSGGTK
jgi:hypothetical protein